MSGSFIYLLLFIMLLPSSDCHHLLVYITTITLNLFPCQQSCLYSVHILCCHHRNMFRKKTHRGVLLHSSVSTLFQKSQQFLGLCFISFGIFFVFDNHIFKNYFIALCSLIPLFLCMTHIMQTAPGKLYLECKTQNKVSYPHELFFELLSSSDFSMLAKHSN